MLRVLQSPHRALKTLEPDLVRSGYGLLFVSPNRPEILYASLKDASLREEPTRFVLPLIRRWRPRALGFASRSDDPTLERCRSFEADLDAGSGATHHALPVPAVIIIDRRRGVAHVHAMLDYARPLSRCDVLAATGRRPTTL